MKTIYTAEVTATGGRSGNVRSSDGIIDMPVSIPEGLGGKGGSTNPEQLFAAGYAACFLSAMQVVAGQQQTRLDPETEVTAKVDLKKTEDHAYALGVTLSVNLKGNDKAAGQQLVEAAHRICPYSVGTRGNIDVKLEVV